MHTKITVPKLDGNYKLYIYCSKNPEDINTIAKVRTLIPTIIIDQANATTVVDGDKEYYVVHDMQPSSPVRGVTWNGPVLNLIPISEYETSIDVLKKNQYTYVNQLNFSEIPIGYEGTMLYYSVIGVEESGSITRLSDVKGVLVNIPYKSGTRMIYSCNELKDNPEEEQWEYVGDCTWNEEISIGNIFDLPNIIRFGYPISEPIPVFNGNEINIVTKNLPTRNYILMEIPNVWQKRNGKYNYRKLKSYKIQNVYNEQYGEFSVPTFQSLLPVSIEKILIMRVKGNDYPEILRPDQTSLCDSIHQIIRKNGIFYNHSEHRKLGVNKYNIPVEENIAVFSETSMQDKIKIQIASTTSTTYWYTIYLVDVYGMFSEPIHFKVET